MRLIILVPTLLAVLRIKSIDCQFKYDMEYVEERIFQKCPEHPDNFIDNAFDMSDLEIGMSDEGTLIVNGALTITKTLPDDLPAFVDTFKKERGTWQPTIYATKRKNLCKAAFDKSEIWNPYWKNSPQVQLTCPLTAGQRIDINVESDTSLNLPMRQLEGEYLAKLEIGDKSIMEYYMCGIVLVNIHKA